jgi:hypothetical protein
MGERRAAIGFKLHTGWAAFVAVSGAADDLDLHLRRRAELLPPGDAIPRFVYHEAAQLAPEAADELVQSATRAADELAQAAVRNALEELRSRGIAAGACGVIVGSGTLKPETPLATILQSHPMIHAAEGTLFQTAIVRACESANVRVLTVRERDVWSAAAAGCGCDAAVLRKRVEALRKVAGPPWSSDEKLATAAALFAGSAVK